ncbi:MAG: hypothetical protein BMS9Abin26_2145 [Gammaproteobacteria bacterium]|nr:MAG: hypothetical protein BMS9Abin26_2145 [Gammaproteobacteria bacterium]
MNTSQKEQGRTEHRSGVERRSGEDYRFEDLGPPEEEAERRNGLEQRSGQERRKDPQ